MAEKPDTKHLRWAIEQRAEIQRTLLALYEFVRGTRPEGSDFDESFLLNHLIAAAFSLWRAVFLAETYRTEESIRTSQENFLAKVISDNTIGFGDDKINRAWTVSYYLDDAKLRIERASAFVDRHKTVDTRRQVVHHLRLIGTRSIPLTEFEWESAHYALRIMMKVLNPTTSLVPVAPQAPRPEGIEALDL